MHLWRFASKIRRDEVLFHDVQSHLSDLPAGTPAAIALAGGTTPLDFYERLAFAQVPWSQITLLPSDERWVDPTDPQSNQGHLIKALKPALERGASWLSLWCEDATPELALPTIEQRITAHAPKPFAVFLGMGEDGHIASLFPGMIPPDDRHDNNDNPPQGAPHRVCVARPDHQLPRISLTLPYLASARYIFLLINGERKLAVLEASLSGLSGVTRLQRLPIADLLLLRPDTRVYCAEVEV